MIKLDFLKRAYTAEVIYTTGSKANIIKSIESSKSISTERATKEVVNGVTIYRYDILSKVRLYSPTDQKLAKKLPFKKGKFFHYDILVCHKGDFVLIAVPYVKLAQTIFQELDTKFSKATDKIKSYKYSKTNISRLLIEAGLDAKLKMLDHDDHIFQINQCTLKYDFAYESGISKQTIKIAGNNLPLSEQYKSLVEPMISNQYDESTLSIEPISLAFSYKVDSIKRCSSFTDRHGNFRFWLGTKVDTMANIILAVYELNKFVSIRDYTPNLPINALDKEKNDTRI